MNHPLVAVLSSKTPTQPEPTAELPLTSLRRIWGCCTLVPNRRLLWWGRSSVRTLSESWRSHPPSSSALRPVEKRQNKIFRMGKTTVSREPFFVYSYYVGLKGIVHPKMKMWCLSAYPQDIQDVGDFVSSVEHKQRFLTQNRCSLSVM